MVLALSTLYLDKMPDLRFDLLFLLNISVKLLDFLEEEESGFLDFLEEDLLNGLDKVLSFFWVLNGFLEVDDLVDLVGRI